ncbi:MAG: ATP-binding cassette domain-containing protein [Chloroflexi bacterium]|nr:ATP-binding cassette domain-containing protein [Chloroflexota bacterium]
MTFVSVTNLGKNYKHTVALKNVTFQLQTGKITGLLGENGAGKSTLLNILATLLQPTVGRAIVGGYETTTSPNDVRRLIGFLPQRFGLHENLTVFEFLDYLAVLKGVAQPEQHIDSVLNQVGLGEVSHKKIRSLSGGMRQRVGIAQAFLNNPPLLLLDEPFSGLDPAERNRFRQLLTHMTAGNRTVFLSTHLVEDIALLANELIVLHKGNLLFMGHPSTLINKVHGRVWTKRIPGDQIETFSMRMTVTRLESQGSDFIVRFISDTPAPVSDAQNVVPTLEDAYLWLINVADA